MRIHSMQQNLQKSDLMVRAAQAQQDPARAAPVEEALRGEVRTEAALDAPRDVPELEGKNIEELRRREPFSSRRRRRDQQDASGAEEEADDSAADEMDAGHIDLTA